MRIGNPYVNKQGEHKQAVTLALGEVAQYLAALPASRQVTVSFPAAEFAATIAPALARITPQAAQQAHEAGVSRDPVRESRKRVSRSPKVQTEPAATPFDAAQLSGVIAQAVAAAFEARERSAAPAKPRGNAAGLAKARAAKAAKRDAQIAAEIAKTS